MSHLDSSETQRALYRPFGAAVEGPPAGEGFGFTGQRLEAEFGVYDYGARWYDPELGRFLQPDPIVGAPFDPQNLNRYSYVRNDPANRVDPTGLRYEDAVPRNLAAEAGLTPDYATPLPTKRGRDSFGMIHRYSRDPMVPDQSFLQQARGIGEVRGILNDQRGGITSVGRGNSVSIARGKSVAKVEAGSQESRSPFEQAVESVIRNEIIPDNVLDALGPGDLIRVAQRRVEMTEARVPPGQGSFEALFAFDKRRQLDFAGKALALALGVTTIGNALLAVDVAFPGVTVGQIIRTGGEILLDASVPGPADFSPQIVSDSITALRAIARDRVPF